ncbi:hypothetical protein LTR66_013466 [Elasticomyces elasticus]|nr:hypothetical protein LTR66_013466 [Elasticomyces elasticus]
MCRRRKPTYSKCDDGLEHEDPNEVCDDIQPGPPVPIQRSGPCPSCRSSGVSALARVTSARTSLQQPARGASFRQQDRIEIEADQGQQAQASLQASTGAQQQPARVITPSEIVPAQPRSTHSQKGSDDAPVSAGQLQPHGDEHLGQDSEVEEIPRPELHLLHNTSRAVLQPVTQHEWAAEDNNLQPCDDDHLGGGDEVEEIPLPGLHAPHNMSTTVQQPVTQHEWAADDDILQRILDESHRTAEAEAQRAGAPLTDEEDPELLRAIQESQALAEQERLRTAARHASLPNRALGFIEGEDEDEDEEAVLRRVLRESEAEADAHRRRALAAGPARTFRRREIFACGCEYEERTDVPLNADHNGPPWFEDRVGEECAECQVRRSRFGGAGPSGWTPTVRRLVGEEEVDEGEREAWDREPDEPMPEDQPTKEDYDAMDAASSGRSARPDNFVDNHAREPASFAHRFRPLVPDQAVGGRRRRDHRLSFGARPSTNVPALTPPQNVPAQGGRVQNDDAIGASQDSTPEDKEKAIKEQQKRRRASLQQTATRHPAPTPKIRAENSAHPSNTASFSSPQSSASTSSTAPRPSNTLNPTPTALPQEPKNIPHSPSPPVSPAAAMHQAPEQERARTQLFDQLTAQHHADGYDGDSEESADGPP